MNFDEKANVVPKAAIRQVIATAQSASTSALQVELEGQAIEQALGFSIGYTFLVGIGAAIAVLLLSFGSVLAMGLPVGTALLGLGTGFGLIGLFSRVVSMPDFATQLALMIGLGVGVDYALFIVTRYREAYRRLGGDVQAAVGEAINTSGRAVIFAGLTVVIALLGMLALGVALLNGVAISAAIAVLSVLAASLTLLPATARVLRRPHRAPHAARTSPRHPAARSQHLLDTLGRGHPAPPVGGARRVHSRDGRARAAGAEPPPRQHRRRQRSAEPDDAPGV